MLALKDPSLFKQQCYLNGTWVDGAETTAVTNPATGELIGHVPKLGREHAAQSLMRMRHGRLGARRPRRSARTS